jgi:hypothetical protein
MNRTIRTANLAQAQKITTATGGLDLIVCLDPRFGCISNSESREEIKQKWLPSMSRATLVNSNSESHDKSAMEVVSYETDESYPSHTNPEDTEREKTARITRRMNERFATAELALLRYCLLVLALSGACGLLTSLLLHVLTAAQLALSSIQR